MASLDHLDDEDDFGGDFAEGNAARRSGNKRSFADLDDDEDDIFGSKKVSQKVEETAPGVATGMILTLRESTLFNIFINAAQLQELIRLSSVWTRENKETSISQLLTFKSFTDVCSENCCPVYLFVFFCSLKNCQDELSKCQTKLEDAKSEIQKWHSAFQNESFMPQGATPEPKFVVNYLQILRSSEESLREQLEKAKKKEAAFIVTFAKREQEIAELKSALRDLRAQLKPPSMQARRLLLDPSIHEEFTRLKNLVEEKDKKVKELQDNIAAVSFTPQSKNGKMLMAKCRTLQEENEEIGNQANEGKMHELTMKLALQKSQNTELRSQFEGICKQMEKLTGDVDRSNELVVILQEKLEAKDDEIQRLKNELLQGNANVEEQNELDTDMNANVDNGLNLVEVQTEN
ncbi:FKBP12-interacting protein of 37 kDa [Striga asiatica]|uniref:FKBP12-interacting protein of 37 kDa n=1 Tax=Striga asiatica TaxID=4170 RepID=A0A5A7Q0Y2_STRAF|nr:FKBP12-interacting protein of 37 kDa [Striga asiatica]